MSALSQDDIKNALKAVKYPGYSRDIVSFGLVKEINAANGAISVSMQSTSANPEAAKQIKSESEQVLKALAGVKHVHVEVKQPAAAPGARRALPWRDAASRPVVSPGSRESSSVTQTYRSTNRSAVSASPVPPSPARDAGRRASSRQVSRSSSPAVAIE